jgi:hypothetical protein
MRQNTFFFHRVSRAIKIYIPGFRNVKKNSILIYKVLIFFTMKRETYQVAALCMQQCLQPGTEMAHTLLKFLLKHFRYSNVKHLDYFIVV